MAKSKSGRKKGRKAKTAKRKTKRATSRAKSSRGKSKRSSGKKRKRTTAEGMKRAMGLKKAGREERVHGMREEPNWPTQMPSPSEIEPSPAPNNLHGQGESANLFQNTTHRRQG